MAKKNEVVPYAAEHVALGPVSIAIATLLAMVPEDVNQNGMVLTNERTKISIPDANGVPVAHTLSLYITRDATSDEERLKVATTKQMRTEQKDAKEKKEMERLAKEKRAAFELGQESTIGALRNIDTLSRSVSFLRGVGNPGNQG